jgi:hypothetical protein
MTEYRDDTWSWQPTHSRIGLAMLWPTVAMLAVIGAAALGLAHHHPMVTVHMHGSTVAAAPAGRQG